MKTKENTIVAFHIGRGGKFYNAGYLTYLGEKEIGNFVDDLFPRGDQLGEIRYYDGGGDDTELTQEEVNSGIGTINIDNDYDTTYTKYLCDCDEREINAILRDRTHYFDKVISLIEEGSTE
ncbi:MAG: hypothetical protein JXR36_04260 [Bacteroidales bacterium]|nr:hypothetical protein [Bacteroidales bacterium]